MRQEKFKMQSSWTGEFKPRDRVSASGNTNGFSLVELLVVMAIILVVAAFAVPTMVTTMDAYRMRSSLSSTLAMTQRARLMAIKKNKTQQMHFITRGNNVVLYYKDQNAAVTTLQNTDAQFWLSTPFSIPGAPTGGPTALTGTTMWGSNLTPTYDQDILFNSRGAPCTIAVANGPCTPGTGYVYYFKYKTASRTRWAAVSVSPAGRIESWFWNGNGWGN